MAETKTTTKATPRKATLNDKLVEIQSRLHAPKDQFNEFGRYKYRNAESILEAAKPLLKEQGCTLTITDDIVPVADRIYVKAVVTVSDGTESVSVQAFAREEETKKGMDGSQVTGASSSYARKYALNGLFAIDDTKDADALNTTPEYTERQAKVASYTPVDINLYWKLVEAYSKGQPTKSGMNAKDWWIKKTHAGEAEQVKFDEDVQDYVLASESNDISSSNSVTEAI